MTSAIARAALTDEEFRKIDSYWRAANYLSVGQIYLLDNPLLREPLTASHIKPRLLGHWGTTPGLNIVYAHLNRIIRQRDANVMLVTGPGHGGPGVVANTYLDGSYSHFYAHIDQSFEGMRKLFRQFSFPGGIPSHTAPETPGSIHEGGELGYALAHAYGAAFDNPDLVVACVIGDGEAETGPLAASWHSNKFLNPATDGAVLPILHLNGYKIANPTVLERIPQDDLHSLLSGYGHDPCMVSGDDPAEVHQQLASAFDWAFDRIVDIQQDSGREQTTRLPRWPLIVLHTPKGWTGPKTVEDLPVEGTWRSHQVPLSECRTNPSQLTQLADWMKSYRPNELFDDDGALRPEVAELAPHGPKTIGRNSHANGGLLARDLNLPDVDRYAVPTGRPGTANTEATKVLGSYLRDVIDRNPKIFRLMGPDETASNRLSAVYERSDKVWLARTESTDEHLAPTGRVMEVLSEHLCQGWLEGYLLTGRHGIFNCYEAFAHIVDSMLNQHVKWLSSSAQIPWRHAIPSLNYLLTSHVWRQDHNGASHQDPGFIDHVANKRPEVVRVYLPPDANTLLAVTDHCLRSRHYVNVVVAGKQPALTYMEMDTARAHCARGLGIWDWASNTSNEPDVVLACAGDVPTLETLAAADILRRRLPELAFRVINVVDIMRLQPDSEHPHGMSHNDFNALFTPDKPIIFAYHGYPWLIHRLAYRHTNHDRMHVRGFKDRGTTTTPFDMVMLNDLDRFHLVMDVIDRVGGMGVRAANLRQDMVDARIAARRYTREHGRDDPAIADWVWEHERAPSASPP
ncbi:phosphoketolase [Mycobacteroides chelonae]|uniref:phosphoketolase family protein n=1 Tax=Mycobacteroides chelonae TaxID=1774 RepID=UPI000993081A|nr:phosphoketolase family protein [Mycobacteroides chelonae]